MTAIPQSELDYQLNEQLVEACYRQDMAGILAALIAGANPLGHEGEALIAGAVMDFTQGIEILAPLSNNVDRAIREAVDNKFYDCARQLISFCPHPDQTELQRMMDELSYTEHSDLMAWVVGHVSDVNAPCSYRHGNYILASDEPYKNHPNRGCALKRSCEYSRLENVKLLLAAGADPICNNWAALCWAARSSCLNTHPDALAILTHVTDVLSVEAIEEAISDMRNLGWSDYTSDIETILCARQIAQAVENSSNTPQRQGRTLKM